MSDAEQRAREQVRQVAAEVDYSPEAPEPEGQKFVLRCESERCNFRASDYGAEAEAVLRSLGDTHEDKQRHPDCETVVFAAGEEVGE